MENKWIEFLNKYKIGLGTGIALVLSLMWGSYEAGTRGWEMLNSKFIDYAEAAEFVTWKEFEIREKHKNIRILKAQINDYKIKKAENKGNKDVEIQVERAIIRAESTIVKEEEAITCLKLGNHNCEF